MEYYIVKLCRKLGSHVIDFAFRETLDKADIIIAVNNTTRKIYGEIIGDRNRIKVIPIGVNLDEFIFSLPPLNFEILSVGALIKRKGFEYLIKAMPHILKEYPTARLHILGDGPRREYLEALVRKLGIEANVKFHGHIPKMKIIEFYKRCRVFVHPSLSESFSPVRLEAMASGIPLVATDAAVGADEMIDDRKTGFLIPPRDPEAIADRVLNLFSDDKLTYKIAIKAREKVEMNYDWNKIGEKYYTIYRKLA